MRPFIALAALLAAGATAVAAEFPPNRLVVAGGTSNDLRQFQGGLEVGLPITLLGSTPRGMAFGPDGMLYVAMFDDDRILRYSGAGVIVGDAIGPGSGLTSPRDLAFGPDGRLYVAAYEEDRVYVFGADGSFLYHFGPAFGLEHPAGIAVGPDGHVFVADNLGDEIFEFDPSGDLLRTFTAAGMDQPTNIALGPEGRVYVVNQGTNSVYVFNAIGNQVDELGEGAGMVAVFDLAFGPDGLLYVSSQALDTIYRFDLDDDLAGTWTSAGGMDGPGGLAFTPFRFKAKVKGRMAIDGSGIATRKETVQLSITPGSGTMMIELQEDGPATLQGQLGTPWLVMQGFEIGKDEAAKQRLFEASFTPEKAFANGMGSLALSVKGKVQSGSFQPKTAKGSLEFGHHHFVYGGKLVTVKRLN